MTKEGPLLVVQRHALAVPHLGNQTTQPGSAWAWAINPPSQLSSQHHQQAPTRQSGCTEERAPVHWPLPGPLTSAPAKPPQGVQPVVWPCLEQPRVTAGSPSSERVLEFWRPLTFLPQTQGCSASPYWILKGSVFSPDLRSLSSWLGPVPLGNSRMAAGQWQREQEASLSWHSCRPSVSRGSDSPGKEEPLGKADRLAKLSLAAAHRKSPKARWDVGSYSEAASSCSRVPLSPGHQLTGAELGLRSSGRGGFQR